MKESMMTNERNSITPLQLFFIIVQATAGFGMFTLSHDLHNYAKSDSWISVLIAGIAFQLVVLIMWSLNNRFPQKNIYEVAIELLGVAVGKLLSVFYIFYFVFISFYTCLYFVSVIKKWLLPSTPYLILIGLFFVTGIYIGQANIKHIARYCGIALIPIILLILIVLAAYNHAHYKYILPVGTVGIKQLFLGANKAIFSFGGIEVILLVLSNVAANQKSKWKAASLSVLFITIVYTYLVFTCLVYFSPVTLDRIPEPVLFLLRSISLFSIVERLDIIIFSIWIIPLTTTYIMYIYMASVGATHLHHAVKRRKIVWLISIFVLVGTMLYPKDELSIMSLGKILVSFAYTFILVIPILLLTLSFIKRKPSVSGEGR
jgi:spore germination protein (amino acid permease)